MEELARIDELKILKLQENSLTRTISFRTFRTVTERLVCDVLAFGYSIDGSMKSVDQTVVDPCGVSAGWVDRQGFSIDGVFTDQFTLDLNGIGVALPLSAAGSSEFVDYVLDRNRAELDFLIGNYFC